MTMNETPDDWENFNEDIYIKIGTQNDEGTDLFKLSVISTQWIENAMQDENQAIYLKYSLVMKYYDEKVIKKHLEQILKQCNLYEGKKAFNCLSHYLEYEAENWLY